MSSSACIKIVVCAPKGGVGKTTIIRNLLVCAKKSGIDCVGVNMDEQRTLVKWFDIRQRVREQYPDFVDIPILERYIYDYRSVFEEVDRDHRLAIFDTPPGHEAYAAAISNLCEKADLIIIPTGVSADDLNEVIPFQNKVAKNKGVFFLNKVNRQTTSFREAQRILNSVGELCPIEIPNYEDIHLTLARGLTVADVEKVNGAADVEAVWAFIRRRMGL